MKQTLALKWFLATALSYLGTPYRWGGDDPSGFDCSGFVIECMKTSGLCLENDDLTADALLHFFSDKTVLDSPERGALLFYLDKKNKANHVVICLDECYQIGASGGNSKTTDAVQSILQNAYVKIRPIRVQPSKTKIIRIFE